MPHRGTPSGEAQLSALRALLVHNPTAGTEGHDKGTIIHALQLADIKVDYVSTKDDDLKRALKQGCDVVIAAGGDGTIDYVFMHLADRSIPIGILPLGSANNIARSLGIAGTSAELAEQWHAGRVHSFHLVEVTYGKDKRELCAEGFGVGLMAALVLLLGAAESADNPPGLFRTVDRGARIYKSIERTGDKPGLLPRLLGPVTIRDQTAMVGRHVSPSVALSEAALHRRVLEKVAPPSILVDEMHRVIHLSENAGRYLQPSGGSLSGDVADLARPELRFELRSALHRFFEQRLA